MTDIDSREHRINDPGPFHDTVFSPPSFEIVDGLQLNLMLGPVNADEARWLFNQLQRLAQFHGVVTLSVGGYGVDVRVTNAKAVKIPWQQR